MTRRLSSCLVCLATFGIFCSPCSGAGKAEDDSPLPRFAVARLGTLRFKLNLRYGSGLATVGFSPDGKSLTATCDKGLGIWDTATGKSATWPPSKSLILAAAFRPDGKTLVFTSARDNGVNHLFAVSLTRLTEDPDDPLVRARRRPPAGERGNDGGGG